MGYHVCAVTLTCLTLVANACSPTLAYTRHGAGLIQIMPGPTTKKIRRSDGKWLVIEITIVSIVRRARFDKFDLTQSARFGSPPKSRKIVISQNRERARNIGADRSNKRRIGLFLSLLMAMARPGFISQSPALKSIPFSSSLEPLSSFDTHAMRVHTCAMPLAFIAYTKKDVNSGSKKFAL